MSTVGSYDDNNIFAKVLRGEARAAKVYEDQDILAFMDLFPQSEGHTLVISKTSKARTILEMDEHTAGILIAGVKHVAQAVNDALEPDGIVITQFNGAAAGQTVFHLHFHVIPRWEGQTLAPHGGARMADGAELAKLAQIIGAKMKAA